MRPPAGYDDLVADAETVAMSGDYDTLDVPKVGPVLARRPAPRSAAALAQASNSKLSEVDRISYLTLFAIDHLAEGETDRLYAEMVFDELPADTMQRVAKAVATWGTARPYIAVINLVAIVAHHWRTMRAKLATHGIADPLTQLKSLHALLDFAEQITMESLARSGEGQDAPKQAQRNMDSFMFKLYAPEPGTELEDGHQPVPGGFDNDEVEDSFDSFVTALGGKA